MLSRENNKNVTKIYKRVTLWIGDVLKWRKKKATTI